MSEQSTSSFLSKLEARVKEVNSLLCIGLDPHGKELASAMGKEYPSEYNNKLSQEDKCDAAFTFCKTIIDATVPYAACYKPNAAFFEALGSDLGNTTLARVLREIPTEIPILLDVKRGDIGSTASAYAEACYDHLGGRVDAVTLSPLMGWDSVGPFVSGKYSNKGAFLLCKTSNPGSNEILALKLADGQTVYERIAKLSLDWSKKPDDGSSATLGLVVGATDSTALSNARAAAGEDVWILAPGVGAQGGNLEEACRSGMNRQGSCMLIPVSRGISQASDPQAAAKELCEQINAVRTKIQADSSSNSGSSNSSGDDSIAPYQKEFLEFSLSQGVLKFGSFVLKSGRTSPYFFNAGLFADGAALFKLGKAYASAIMASPELADSNGKVKFDVVFGPAYKGISLGAVVCAALYSDYGINAGFAYDRKEAKDHGEGGKLVGASMENKRVLVVDDVITAGTAIRQSADMLKTIGAEMVGVVIALDRAEKRSLDDPVSAVQAVQRDLAVSVVSIASLPQLQAFLQKSPDYGEDVLKSVTAYRSEYGV